MPRSFGNQGRMLAAMLGIAVVLGMTLAQSPPPAPTLPTPPSAFPLAVPPDAPTADAGAGDRYINVGLAGKKHRCKLIVSWDLPNGGNAYQVQAVDTHEMLTLVRDAAQGDGSEETPVRIFRWGTRTTPPRGAPVAPPLPAPLAIASAPAAIPMPPTPGSAPAPAAQRSDDPWIVGPPAKNGEHPVTETFAAQRPTPTPTPATGPVIVSNVVPATPAFTTPILPTPAAPTAPVAPIVPTPPVVAAVAPAATPNPVTPIRTAPTPTAPVQAATTPAAPIAPTVPVAPVAVAQRPPEPVHSQPVSRSAGAPDAARATGSGRTSRDDPAAAADRTDRRRRPTAWRAADNRRSADNDRPGPGHAARAGTGGADRAFRPRRARPGRSADPDPDAESQPAMVQRRASGDAVGGSAAADRRTPLPGSDAVARTRQPTVAAEPKSPALPIIINGPTIESPRASVPAAPTVPVVQVPVIPTPTVPTPTGRPGSSRSDAGRSGGGHADPVHSDPGRPGSGRSPGSASLRHAAVAAGLAGSDAAGSVLDDEQFENVDSVGPAGNARPSHAASAEQRERSEQDEARLDGPGAREGTGQGTRQRAREDRHEPRAGPGCRTET